MATLYTEQSKNTRKTWILMAVFLAVVAALGWFASYYYGSFLFFYIALAFSLIMNIGSYWYSDKIVLAMTRAKPVTRESNPLLWNITENLSITAGLPMPRLYTIDDPSPNAFATGRNKEHAAVAVTTGLLAMMDRSELEGVVAHELAHVGNKDILVSTVVVVLAGLVIIMSDFLLRLSLFGGAGRGQNRGGGQFQVVLVILGIVFAALAPLIAMAIRFSISRKREFLADASGALLTRYPEGLASALRKLGAYGGKMKTASKATAHLFIANPFGRQDPKRVSYIEKLFMSHPPVEDRVKALIGNQGR